MKIYIISLTHSTKRRKFMTKQMKTIGLDFKFFNAIHGKNLTQNDIAKYCDLEAIEKNPGWLSPNAIGCAMSHYGVYKEIVRNGEEKALVLEDDSVISDDITVVVNHLSQRKQKEELILLYYRAHNQKVLSTYNAENISTKYKIISPFQYKDIPGSAVGYYITKDLCEKLIETRFPISSGSDNWNMLLKKVGLLHAIKLVSPMPLKDGAFQSEIGYDKSSFKKKLKKIAHNTFFLKPLLKKFRRNHETQMTNFVFTEEPSKLRL